MKECNTECCKTWRESRLALINDLQDENKRLRARIETLEAADYEALRDNDAPRQRIAALEKALRELLEASDIGDPNEFAAFEDEWNRAKALSEVKE